MGKISNTWVFSDNVNRLDELMGAALSLCQNVNVFSINDDDSQRAFALGASDVYVVKSDDEVFENYIPSFAKAIKDGSENSLILLPNTRRGKAIASALGVALNAGVSTEVNKIEILDSGVSCQRMMYGGLATSKELINTNFAIVVLASGSYPQACVNENSNKEAINLEFIAPKNSIKCLKRLPKEVNNIDLNRAKKIVAIGRGIAKKEDIAMSKELCELIGAELGCSRPIAEGEKWMEHERYIGISSVMPKPEIYIAIGISGQIQHMVGAKDSGKIIAINKDKNAPIFDYADYGIVGDLYKILPQMIKLIK